MNSKYFDCRLKLNNYSFKEVFNYYINTNVKIILIIKAYIQIYIKIYLYHEKDTKYI